MIGLAISNSQLLDPRVTRAWMKPRGHTGSLISSVGAPWEINRLALTISASSSRTRISDLYTKLGGQQKYATIFALSPDHKIGYSIMVAGDTAAGIDRFTLRNSVTEVFVQAAEHAAWEHAEKAFTGTFVDPETEGTNLTLTVDTDRPGLGLKEWFEEGVDIRANVSGSPALDADAQSFRLYPMGLVSEGPSSLLESYGSESSERKRMAWRARFQPKKLVAHSAVEGGQGLFDNSRCEQWASVDFLDLYSNGIGTDEFVLGLVDGRLETVEYRSTGMVLKRLE